MVAGVAAVVGLVLLLGCALPEASGDHPAGDHRDSPGFGHSMLKHFQLEQGFLNLNHGSFGATPKAVRAYQEKMTSQMEARPDDWFRGGYQRLLDKTRAELASYLSADADDVVFVENASSGVNAVLRSVPLAANDTVAFLSCAYPMVTNTAEMLARAGRASVRKIPLAFPVRSPQEVIDHLEQALRQDPAHVPALLSISHIVSTPAVILPVEEMTRVAKRHGVKHVLIDGAHALGHISVNLTALAQAGVDFYVGNGHKWLYSPKGSAFLWTRPSLQRVTIPTVVSSDFAFHDYMRDFLYTGTRDYTPFVSISAAFSFRETVGGDQAVTQYMIDLSRWASDYLSQRWGTEAAAPPSMTGAMATVRLPTTDATLAQGLTPWLIENHDVQIVVFSMSKLDACVAENSTACGRWINPSHAGSQVSFLTGASSGSAETPHENGKETTTTTTLGSSPGATSWWVRLSAQIYVEQSDFVRLADLIDAYLSPDRMPAV